LTADGIVVIDNECPEDWVKGKLKDMMKAPGYGRQQAIRAKTLITSDYEKYKSLEDRGNVFLVDASKPFEESLDRFFNELKIRL
jgi:hypothetical protein